MSGWHIDHTPPPVPADYDGRRRHDWRGESLTNCDLPMVTGETREEVERSIQEVEGVTHESDGERDG